MGDPAGPDVRSDIAHLGRRLGFGLRPSELDALAPGGYEAAVEDLLAVSGPDAADANPAPAFSVPRVAGTSVEARQAAEADRRRQSVELVTWWLRRMVATSLPLVEKMVLLWHGHFATSIQKVREPLYMYDQNQILRSSGLGRFTDLTMAVAKDPAMLVWLDSNSNVKGHPNENFARELMELFTLGIGNYSEDDVKEAARCFTGWGLDRASDSFVFRPRQHDDGAKTLLGRTGDLSGEDAITLVTGLAASARFVVGRLWSHLAYPVATTDPVVDDLVGAYGHGDVAALVKAIALHPRFRSADARNGLVKQPIEWMIGSLRALGLPADTRAGADLRSLGQTPFEPPSVGGWPQNAYWLSTASALARLRSATRLAGLADLSALTSTAEADRPAAVARLLGVDAWSAATASALSDAAANPKALVALALVSAEYVVN